MKYLCKCEYCGVEWVDEETYAWKSNLRRCPHCGEVKNVKTRSVPEEGRDIFGYRFSPPFPPKYPNFE